MLERILKFSIQHRFLVVMLAVGAAGFGVFSLQRLPIDAVPDITNNQVQINTLAPALSPEDVDIYFARQQINERLAEAKESLPAGAEPKMGAITTGLGEVYMWAVEYEH